MARLASPALLVAERRLRAGQPARAVAVLFGLAMMALTALPAAAQPGQPHKLDQERARAERGRGSIMPLEQLLRSVALQLEGRQLGVELEEDDGRMVYEIKWLLPDGRRIEIELDARNSTWLSMKGPRLETVFRRPAAAAPRP